MQCGLLGRKLGHSYSPQIHQHLGDYSYTLFEKEPEELAAFFQNSTFTGLNVTIPYKKDVIPYCSELSSHAQKLGAVNTIVRRSDGTLIGHNTDYFGFLSMVKRSGLSLEGQKVLVLGSVGASVTPVAVMQELGAQVVVISRSGENNYDHLSLHSDAAAVVNATPVGMYPEVGRSPVDLHLFPRLEAVWDMIYNPARTALLQQAEQRGLIAQNGLWMLVAQAKESAEWFLGEKIRDDVIPLIHDQLRIQMENIILIGMPGCGKSTIGKFVAQKMNKEFVDSDDAIIKAAGMSIPDIFALKGESAFRKIETQVLEQLGKRSGLVIATGGGCVTQHDNYPLLHQNGTIIWLKRQLDQLPTDGRPLSQSGKLQQMYKTRSPLYSAFSDLCINNDTDEKSCVNAILEALHMEV